MCIEVCENIVCARGQSPQPLPPAKQRFAEQSQRLRGLTGSRNLRGNDKAHTKVLSLNYGFIKFRVHTKEEVKLWLDTELTVYLRIYAERSLR